MSSSDLAWTQVVAMVNGLVVGSTLAVLHERGVLEALARGEVVPGNPAYLAVAQRGLIGLNWRDQHGLSQQGAEALAWAQAYQAVPAWLAHGQDRGVPAPEPLAGIGETAGARQVELHLRGFELASQLESLHPDLEVCQRLGWSDDGRWTDLGAQARPLLHLFNYPLSYLRMLAQAEALLFGDPESVPVDGETHIDRKRDIGFSGRVFSSPLAEAFLALIVPLFQGERPPRCLVDLGCGDGRMLLELSRLLSQRLGREPEVVLIASDTSSVAREVAAETLQSATQQAHVIASDIGCPESLVEQLHGLGVRPEETLYLCKSVVHNRTFRGGDAVGEPSSGAWVGAGGEPLASGQVEGDLTQFFSRWKSFLKPHGLVCAEAHTVSDDVLQACWERSLQTCLDLTHSYSRQLLVEIPVYRRAAERAGLTRLGGYEFGAATQGHNAMTVDRFIRS